MPFEFRLPDIGEGVAEGEVVKWFVREGDTIAEDSPLVSVLTDKANVEIPSPKAGKVVKLHAQVGEKVKVGGLLGTIETGGTGPATVPNQPAPGPTSKPAAPSPPTKGRAPGASSAAPPPTASPPAKGGAPSASAAPPPTPAPAGRVLASPFLRRKAAEMGIDLAQVRGSGPEGRITEEDLRAPTPPAAGPTPASASKATPSVPPAQPTGRDEITKIPIRGLRRVIADHMMEATHRAAHFTYVEEVDATELARFRERMARHLDSQGVKLSYLPFVIRGVIAGLRKYPRMNATMNDELWELWVHSAHHIGVATATDEGLIVPVIHDADSKSIGQLSREIQDLAERGREGKLTRAELTGSTFTITSLGALGGVMATPILNYPEVAILGVHKIQRRPVYRADGTIGPADLMNLSVSLDHRVLDGILAAQFLAVVKSYLEDPHQLFAEMA